VNVCPPRQKLLFLCTGNYYRSRFAEALFNRLAGDELHCWQAESRGLALGRGWANVGPISPHALRALFELGIAIDDSTRYPLQLQASDLASAAHIVALKETEHRPLLAERFPDWVGRVDYWHIDDVDQAPPSVALAELEQGVRRLIRTLAAKVEAS